MIEFYFPTSSGEWAAFISAALTALFGLSVLLFPALPARMTGATTEDGRRQDLAGTRARGGGFHLGIGLCALMFAQPLLYLALGGAWALAAIGRLVSLVVDRQAAVSNAVMLVVEAALAAPALLYGIGMI